MKLLSESHLSLRGALHGCASILCLHNVLCFQPWAVRPMAKDTRHNTKYTMTRSPSTGAPVSSTDVKAAVCCSFPSLNLTWLWHDQLDYLRLDTQMPLSLGLKLSSIHQIPVLRHPWNQPRSHEWQRAITKHRVHFG